MDVVNVLSICFQFCILMEVLFDRFSIFILDLTDRRNVLMNLTTDIPKQLLQLDGKIRTVEATNNEKNLRIYLSFSVPVLNSSEEILGVLHSSSGLLSSTNRNTLGNHRFGYVVSYSTFTSPKSIFE